MCSYKTLSHSNDGYIILCNECGHLQLAFGTSAVKFDTETYSSFSTQVETLVDVYDCKGFYNQKTYILICIAHIVCWL